MKFTLERFKPTLTVKFQHLKETFLLEQLTLQHFITKQQYYGTISKTNYW